MVFERIRYGAIGDSLSEALDDCGLPNTGFTDDDGIILEASTKNLNDLSNFTVAPQNRVDRARACFLRDIGRIGFEIFLRRIPFKAFIRGGGEGIATSVT